MLKRGPTYSEIDDNSLAKKHKSPICQSEGLPILVTAISINSVNGVRLLLEAGTNPNDNYLGNTPLTFALTWHAISNRIISTEVIQTLIHGGANVNLPDIKKTPPLIHAVRHGKIKEVEMLLQAGANPNAEDANGDTALMHAVKMRSVAIFNLLVANHADVNFRNSKGKSVLDIVISKDFDEFIPPLSKANADFNVKNEVGNTPLLNSIPNSPKVAHALIKVGVDVNLTGDKGMTPLMQSVGFETIDLSLVKALIKAKANVNATRDGNINALMMAIANSGNVDCINLLAEAGANVNYVEIDDLNDETITPLALAVRHIKNPEPVIKALIHHGADPAIDRIDGEDYDCYYFTSHLEAQEDGSSGLDGIERFKKVMRLVHILALEGNKGKNRLKYIPFNPTQEWYPTVNAIFPVEVIPLIIEDRTQQFKNSSLPYLSHYVMKSYPSTVPETFLNYQKGLEIVFNPLLPNELRRMILGYCHQGPLSYSETEDQKARTVFEILKKRYTP